MFEAQAAMMRQRQQEARLQEQAKEEALRVAHRQEESKRAPHIAWSQDREEEKSFTEQKRHVEEGQLEFKRQTSED